MHQNVAPATLEEAVNIGQLEVFGVHVFFASLAAARILIVHRHLLGVRLALTCARPRVIVHILITVQANITAGVLFDLVEDPYT